MWNIKYVIIPVITGATGTVTKGLNKNLEAIPGEHSIDSLQNTAILGTSRVIRNVLQLQLDARAVGVAVGSREEVLGGKWPVTRVVVVVVVVVVVIIIIIIIIIIIVT
jgi:hypothetical protein